jgi:AcrR family transcriptional regulator
LPKVSETHREERRRQIMDGARRAFGRLGYHGATVPELEAETGLSRGAIFSYFPTKLDLFVACAQDDRARLLRLWVDHGYEAVLHHIGEDHPEWPSFYIDATRLLRDDPALRERWEAMNPELGEELRATVTAMRERGEIRSDLPMETIGRFLGLVLDGLAVQVAARFGPPVDVDGTFELIRSALAPK